MLYFLQWIKGSKGRVSGGFAGRSALYGDVNTTARAGSGAMPRLETFIAAYLCCGEGLFFLPRRPERLPDRYRMPGGQAGKIRRVLAKTCARICYNSRKHAFGPNKHKQTGKEETLC
jgi:hypothetical protein